MTTTDKFNETYHAVRDCMKTIEELVSLHEEYYRDREQDWADDIRAEIKEKGLPQHEGFAMDAMIKTFLDSMQKLGIIKEYSKERFYEVSTMTCKL